MRYFEDLHVGDVFELGRSEPVTAEAIVEFARRFDPQPFHLDPEAAKDSLFGGLVASGWHTAAIYMRLLVDGFLSRTAGEGAPGVDELRWLQPVRPGDVLRGRLTVLEVRESRSRPTIGIMRGAGEMFNQRDETVFRLISNGFFRRRTPGGSPPPAG